MYVLVKNLSGTGSERYSDPHGYSSWKEFWKANKGYWPSICSAKDCYKPAEVGAHVKKVYGGNQWYIVPLCSGCNHRTDSFYVEESMLVPINR